MIRDTAIPLARLAKLGLACLLAGGGLAKGEIQFDVFMGFAGKARQGDWFPVTFEIHNDGPTFDGQIELRPRFGDNPVYRYDVELATNTRKRFTIPVFADTQSGWSARLRNGRKTVAKHDELKLDSVDAQTILVGALSGQQAGGPILPKTRFKRRWENESFAPVVSQLQADIFPDDPIALGGLHSLYLNSARAIHLRPGQAAALTTWVLGGGHLMLAVDQPGDVTGTPWLAGLVRGQFDPVQNSAVGQALGQWLTKAGYSNIGRPDDGFAAAQLAAAGVRLDRPAHLVVLARLIAVATSRFSAEQRRRRGSGCTYALCGHQPCQTHTVPAFTACSVPSWPPPRYAWLLSLYSAVSTSRPSTSSGCARKRSCTRAWPPRQYVKQPPRSSQSSR